MNISEKKPSLFSAIVKCKCPRCRQGAIFEGSVFELKNYRKTKETCPVCGLRYELELGFFWSAMFIGYVLNVALSVGLGVAAYVLFDNPDTWVYMTMIVSGVVLCYRFNFRYSRTILLYLFAPPYDKSYEARVSSNEIKN